jgi:prevent-host-death family protein
MSVPAEVGEGMTTIDIEQAKARFTDLVERVSNGEDVVIEKEGKAVARLVAVAPEPRPKRRLGGLEGKIEVPPDYSDKEDPEILAMFGIE